MQAPMTPAKITWRLPAPLGCPFVVIAPNLLHSASHLRRRANRPSDQDKLEVDKKGGVKLEGSTEKVPPQDLAFPILSASCFVCARP